MSPTLPRELFLQAACTLEVLARKPGNSSPAKPLLSPSPEDLLFGSAAIAPILATAQEKPLGQTILEAARASICVSPTNANLGIILLLTPLAAVPDSLPLYPNVSSILEASTTQDACLAFEAIRLMVPGGMGQVPQQDLAQAPTVTLIQAMRLARDRDFIAELWATGFARLFQEGLPALGAGIQATGSIEASVLLLYLHKLACDGDTLICRKHGMAVNHEVAQRAAGVLASQWPQKQPGIEAFRRFDSWLRQNKYNPGTTADYVAAVLYAAFREEILNLPLPFAWSAGQVC
ncbi:MAG: triphosphoribosyl-dephospho-CoA synthetase [Gemmataceae bacterium]|nr:triphosphoribosyl-dephospho-CoA synthetase [Gemmataceae bacterium]